MILEPTGIPPHVGLSIQVQAVLATLGNLVEQFGEHGKNLETAVQTALDNTALENGHVTVNRVVEMMEGYHDRTVVTLENAMKGMRSEIQRLQRKAGGVFVEAGVVNEGEDGDDDGGGFFFEDDDDDEDDGDDGDDSRVGGGGGQGIAQQGREGGPLRNKNKNRNNRNSHHAFAHPDGKFYGVPRGYDFPSRSNLREGLRCWMFDQVVSADDTKKVRALRRFKKVTLFPPTLARKFRTNWQPIFRFLHPVLSLIPSKMELSETAFDALYDDCLKFLKSRVSFLWGPKKNPELFVVGTWSSKTSFSYIQKHGTDEDKSYLKEPGNRNVAHGKNAGGTNNTATTTTRNTTTATATATLKRMRSTTATTNPKHPLRRDRRNEKIAAAATGVPPPAPEGRLGVPPSATGGGVRRGVSVGGGTSAGDPMMKTTGLNRSPGSEPGGTHSTRLGSSGRKTGICCVTGCQWSQLELLHTCHACGGFVHILCAEPFSQTSEDERYCDSCCPYKRCRTI